MTKPRAAKIFLAHDGTCEICGVRIRQGEAWEVEHREALSLGGSDDDANCYPVHLACHKGKTRSDAKAKAKRDRQITAGWAGKPKKRGWQSRYRKKVNGVVVDRETGRPVR